MGDNASKHKRIVRNTLMLYFRMLIAMLVGLFSSRILLQALGVVDYGIYNAVGGFVAMFSIISGSLTSSISRFITFELGIGNITKLKKFFSTSIFVQLGLSVVIILIAETVGLWFLSNKMVIPSDRFYSSLWVYQLSLFSFIISLFTVPFNACIIAHERMDIFAYISIYEVICKLLICYAVIHSPIDKLIFYAILLVLVSVSVQVIYMIFCKKHFEECSFRFVFEKKLFQGIFSFAGWNFIGSAGWILRNQGGTILINIFAGPALNTANGIAGALTGAVTAFVSNFTTAFNPQITKDYAAKLYKELNQLLIYGAKISFYMMFFLGLPVMLNTHFILHLWLGGVPQHTVAFVRLILLFSLCETISTPLITAKLATGRIRNYQLVVGGIQLLAVPLAYLVLKLGAPVESIYVSYIVTSLGCLVARMFMMQEDIPGLSIRRFLFDVVINVWLVAALSSIVPYIVYMQFQEGWECLIISGLTSVLSCFIVMYYIGLKKTERNKLSSLLKSKLKIKNG